MEEEFTQRKPGIRKQRPETLIHGGEARAILGSAGAFESFILREHGLVQQASVSCGNIVLGVDKPTKLLGPRLGRVSEPAPAFQPGVNGTWGSCFVESISWYSYLGLFVMEGKQK